MTPEDTEATKTAASEGKPFPWWCPECGKKEVRPVTVQHVSPIKHDGRLYSVTVPRLRVPRCDACGELVFDNDADAQIAQALREQLGLLSGEQIRKNREVLGLSQRALAEQLVLQRHVARKPQHLGMIAAPAAQRMVEERRHGAVVPGVAVETISRWENGVLTQTRAMDRYLRVYFGVPAARAALVETSRIPSLGSQVET